MPVFGKGHHRLAKVELAELMEINRVNGKRVRTPTRRKWHLTRSKLTVIEKKFGFSLRDELTHQMELEQKRNGSKAPAVLDWGCGMGTAAIELARSFEKTLINVYGCSDLSYSSWQGTKQVKFIHATKEDALRYFKPQSLNLIYSHFGLCHLKDGLRPYLQQWLPKLKVGGKLVTNLDPSQHGLLPTELEIKSMQFEARYSNFGQVMCVTRKN
jgi:trans-aconitate methyltransferase